jgi:predicted lysophospholipase L1 biosynthesis ABC-type transport system permease subunit
MLLRRWEDPVVTVRSRDACSVSPDAWGKDAKRPPPNALRKALPFFYTFLLIFAVVAVLVGRFMMFNTFSITVAQLRGRTGCSARLGASRRQILSSVLVEALAVGIIASILGIFAGLAIAIGLKNLLVAVGVDTPSEGLVLTSTIVAICLVVGIGVTVSVAGGQLGAWVSSRRRVSWAICRSSRAVTTMVCTVAPAGVMSRSSRLRTVAECSPTPPVNTSTSRPPVAALIAAMPPTSRWV